MLCILKTYSVDVNILCKDIDLTILSSSFSSPCLEDCIDHDLTHRRTTEWNIHKFEADKIWSGEIFFVSFKLKYGFSLFLFQANFVSSCQI